VVSKRDPPAIIVVTYEGDNAAPQLVLDALDRRGAESWRLDSDRFPLDIRLSMVAISEQSTLSTPAGAVPLDRLRSVWVRRLAIAHALPTDDEPGVREASVAESRLSMRAWLDGLDVRVMDRPSIVDGARDKMRQLRVARDVGMAVPATLLSNDPEQVRRFAAELQGAVVAKMLHPFALGSPDDERVVFTSPVRPEDLADLAGLSRSPMVFQQAIRSVVELRVTVVGETALVAALDRGPDQPVDWREDAPRLASRWEGGALTPSIQAQLAAILRKLGLRFGAFDLAVDDRGTCWFLEVNPSGEWLWLEQGIGLPIADAIAAELMRER
jgi:hypothetical protein